MVLIQNNTCCRKGENDMHKEATKPLRQIVLTAALIFTGMCSATPDVGAALLSPAAIVVGPQNDGSLVTPVMVRRGGVARRTTVVGPRGGVASRTVVRRGAVVRPGFAGGGVRWARPGRYYWPRGGAIAAGAAIGFVTAATAAAWAGAAPAPGMCWYYTDPSRTQGFWDYCQ
jgi:hypothetical protein